LFERVKTASLNDFFTSLSQRKADRVYFYRFTCYSDEINNFLTEYYEASRTNGVIIEGGIANPDRNNLAYYYEIMGESFQHNKAFITQSLSKWLPRMNNVQREQVASAIDDTLLMLARAGKNENILKNIYIKFMCWLYYKFERVTNKLGNDEIPKIFYEGAPSNHELLLMTVLSKAGCDIVLLENKGDENYLKNDPSSLYSDLYNPAVGQAFPEGYSFKTIRVEFERRYNLKRICGDKPKITVVHNDNIKIREIIDLAVPTGLRKNTENRINTLFCRINGAASRLTYQNELSSFYKEIKASKRKFTAINGELPNPLPDEIGRISRGQYNSVENAVLDLSKNIITAQSNELQQLIKYEFIRLMTEYGGKPGVSLNKVVNTAVYILCWLNKYQHGIFGNWHYPDTGCLVYMNGCRTEAQEMFIKLIASLPCDVIILVPDLNKNCILKDSSLLEVNFEESLAITEFPDESLTSRVGTSAYHAERELDSLMYQDTGLYRNHQYSKATSVVMRTMYEEIEILWDQELKYRPNFSTDDNEVKVPVIFAKVSGVTGSQIPGYWQTIKKLLTENTILLKAEEYFSDQTSNIKPHAVSFFKNGRLQRNAVKAHKSYVYGFLREDMQEHILDKLELMINQRIIEGTFVNGMEYTIISVALSIRKDILRKMQNFDFTKKNPKIIYINTSESMIKPEEAILLEFLSLIGFDVVFFIPTGYQNIEKYYTSPIVEEHQIGEYIYDLTVPDFSTITTKSWQSWCGKLFGRSI